MDNEYIKEFINACQKLCNEAKDYTKTNVKIHNKAMKKLVNIYCKLSDNKESATKIYEELMNIDDNRIKIISASHSLSLNINTDKAKKILKDIMENSQNPFEKFDAEVILKSWQEGKLIICQKTK